MIFTARWIRHGKIIDTERYDDRDMAIREAIARFAAFANTYGATSAEVFDENGDRHLLHVGRTADAEGS